jgi:hypothetical protein
VNWLEVFEVLLDILDNRIVELVVFDPIFDKKFCVGNYDVWVFVGLIEVKRLQLFNEVPLSVKSLQVVQETLQTYVRKCLFEL